MAWSNCIVITGSHTILFFLTVAVLNNTCFSWIFVLLWNFSLQSLITCASVSYLGFHDSLCCWNFSHIAIIDLASLDHCTNEMWQTTSSESLFAWLECVTNHHHLILRFRMFGGLTSDSSCTFRSWYGGKKKLFFTVCELPFWHQKYRSL